MCVQAFRFKEEKNHTLYVCVCVLNFKEKGRIESFVKQKGILKKRAKISKQMLLS